EGDIGLVVVGEGAGPAREAGAGRVRRRGAPVVVGGVEAVHHPVVVLLVCPRPLVVRVDQAELGVVVGGDGAAHPVGVGVAGGGDLDVGLAVGGQLGEVVIERSVLLHDDEDVIDRDGRAVRRRGALRLGRELPGLVHARGAPRGGVGVARRGHHPVPVGRAGEDAAVGSAGGRRGGRGATLA